MEEMRGNWATHPKRGAPRWRRIPPFQRRIASAKRHTIVVDPLTLRRRCIRSPPPPPLPSPSPSWGETRVFEMGKRWCVRGCRTPEWGVMIENGRRHAKRKRRRLALGESQTTPQNERRMMALRKRNLHGVAAAVEKTKWPPLTVFNPAFLSPPGTLL